jgi:hypothetical protein
MKFITSLAIGQIVLSLCKHVLHYDIWSGYWLYAWTVAGCLAAMTWIEEFPRNHRINIR